MTDDDILRRELIALIEGVDARMTFRDAVAGFPADAMNVRPPNVSYTPWHLLEHVRITQADILDYILNRSYLGLDWPRQYWPAEDATATTDDWTATIDGFADDAAALRAIVSDPATNLTATIPGTPGHTIVREIRIVGDHNAYHVGEFASLRQVMGTWPRGHTG